ncbi:MAG: polysaccharide pyruvyl transferase CsaB [Clostridia bacterium]|nr:polysaccharide pyruvyl transferase CsaB [Clostridia bacterium]
MKVLLVLMGMDIGGAETHVLELARGLKRMGVDVSIASNGGAYVAVLDKENIPHHKIPLHSRSIKAMASSYFKLKKLIKKEKYDVVHGHARIPSFLLGLLCKKMHFNFVTSAHWVFEVSPLLKLLSDWGYRTIAVSEDIKAYLTQNYGTYPQDISVTINGIPLDKFSIPKDMHLIRELGLSETSRKIVSISRMDKDRSLLAHHLIEIAPDLVKKDKDIEIVLVGGGNDLESVRAEAETVNRLIGKKVIHLTGARTDINRFVSISDFVVAVSRSALECMCGSVPVIVAGNEGYLGIFSKETLKNAIETNFCCRGMELASPNRLKEDLFTLLSLSPDKAKEVGAYGREIVEQFYSADRMVKDNYDVYTEIIQNGNQHKDFVISGYYGHNNSGDDALLCAIIKQIRAYKPNARFTVLSANPKETEKKHGVHAVNRFNFLAIRKAIRNCSVLISGGGSLIQDVTSTKSLLYYSNLISYAKKKGKKVYIYGNGIGPIVHKKNEEKARTALMQADLITLRDEKSKELLDHLCPEAKEVYVTADPALALQPAENKNTIIQAENLPEGEYVAISIRNWKCERDMAKELAECADSLQQNHGLIPVFVPMQIPEDLSICQRAVSLMQTKGYCVQNRYEHEDLIAFCGQCKFVIGMRLHILLYAAASATPCIGLIYDPKILGCLSMLEQKKYLLDLDQADKASVITLCELLLGEYETVCTALKEKADLLSKRAMQNGELAVKLLEE